MATEADRQRFRVVMGHFATGVAVITAQGPGGPAGLTANALCSLSLDPLLLLACFENSARTLPIVRETGRFGINVLRSGQDETSGVFASKVPERDKFAGLAYTVRDGVPVLDDTLAWLVCDVRELLPGGDHTIATGAVRTMHLRGGDPLVWFRGAYRTIG